MLLVGVDTGGTFTDFVVRDEAGIRVHKELSTPNNPDIAIMNGLSALGVRLQEILIIHGTTVATNAVLEKKLSKTMYVTNRGFSDLLTIGRQARAELYNLTPPTKPAPVPKSHCVEIGGRINSSGLLVEDVSEQDMTYLEAQVRKLTPEAIAVNLLFSFLRPEIEHALAERLGKYCFVACSVDVLPDYREYERGIATWLNAALGPKVRNYLENLARSLDYSSLTVMQSNGMTCSPEYASNHPVNLLLSGPAGGLIGASHMAKAAGFEKIMTFDMGGTSTDVALIDGQISLTTEGQVGGYPVAIPMVEMHTIGAGGGSIARVDLGGLLQVGPSSAGAVPGPVCYGQGGKSVTVTDANLVMGRLPLETRFPGGMRLDFEKAVEAIEDLAEVLGLSLNGAAQGVLEIVNNLMGQALKEISIERGIDPTDFTLVPFGGSGGLHCCSLAEALSLRAILIPASAGVLSALGMTVAKPGRKLSRSVRKRSEDCSDEILRDIFDDMVNTASAELLQEGHGDGDFNEELSVDVCYFGQSTFLTLPFDSLSDLCRLFPRAHERRYGHILDKPIEIVSLRVIVTVEQSSSNLTTTPFLEDVNEVSDSKYPVIARHSIKGAVRGPTIVLDSTATIFIDNGWTGRLDVAKNLILEYD